jgi:capsular exopolysaccharide synthesis family protein
MSSDPRPGGDAVEPSQLVGAARVVRERWPLILSVTVICTLLMVGLSLTATKKYESTASLLMSKSDLTALINPNANNDSDPARDLGTNLQLVTSGTVADRVAKSLPGSEAGVLLKQTTAESDPDADIIRITSTDPDPARAAAIANAFANQFVAYRRSVDQERIAAGERLLTDQLNAVPANQTAQRAQLEAALSQVTALKGVTTGNAEVVDRAEPSATPSSPNLKRNAALGLIAGLVGGLALAFLVDLFDRRVKAVEDFEGLYGTRALTTVPQRLRDPSTHRERQAALEPFRILRNGLAFLSSSGPVKVVMVTSASPGEGKSTVAAGLARAAALAGQSVVLVEADLRRPTFHEQFRLDGERRGLTTALVGSAPISELTRPALPGLKTMRILPAGPVPPNSAELLRGTRMNAVLTALEADTDLVILDAPPLLPVADARVLLDNENIDACIIVARAYKTTRDEIRRTRSVLDASHVRSLGLVVNGLRDAEAGYEYYGASEETLAPRRTSTNV